MEESFERQCDMVVDYIKEHGSITSKEAEDNLAVGRLSSRIFDLKKRGYVINKVMESGKNRFGRETHYARYSLEERS